MPEKEAQPAVCDGQDHGVTAERLARLTDEAHAFNNLLRVNEADAAGPNHDAAVRDAAAQFYKYLPVQPDRPDQSNESRAFDASKAFYEQLAQLPIGERKALTAMSMQENNSIAANDPAMPTLEVKLDSTAFIDDMTVKYPWPFSRDAAGKVTAYISAEQFTFHYLGMCAQYKPWSGQTSGGAASVELPSLGFGHF